MIRQLIKNKFIVRRRRHHLLYSLVRRAEKEKGIVNYQEKVFPFIISFPGEYPRTTGTGLYKDEEDRSRIRLDSIADWSLRIFVFLPRCR